MPQVAVIIGSSRPNRVGEHVARWAAERALSHGSLDVRLIDLAELDLPLLDEPHHPARGEYHHEHTRAWSRTVEQCDAFVFVTPEYNSGYSAVLKNAIDYLFHEWQNKPVAFISYGGVSAGLRAVQQLKQVVTALKMVPLVEAVALPFVSGMMEADGSLTPTSEMESSLKSMLDELVRWTEILDAARAVGPRD